MPAVLEGATNVYRTTRPRIVTLMIYPSPTLIQVTVTRVGSRETDGERAQYRPTRYPAPPTRRNGRAKGGGDQPRKSGWMDSSLLPATTQVLGTCPAAKILRWIKSRVLPCPRLLAAERTDTGWAASVGVLADRSNIRSPQANRRAACPMCPTTSTPSAGLRRRVRGTEYCTGTARDER